MFKYRSWITLKALIYQGFRFIQQALVSQTHKSFEDSFLYQKQEEIYQRLGIPGRVNHE